MKGTVEQLFAMKGTVEQLFAIKTVEQLFAMKGTVDVILNDSPLINSFFFNSLRCI